ncbi:uncharacterized protein LOC107607448 [Arachis ipaensis]|uniref:uncharacterized protein LOC107607448 n=1 Tax=Arachis ipaensis TaxID=130454 RepID=UPI000A2B6167|nr:uncharacterized protein LOC107607448 [Arachis ipaensis]
MALHDGAKGVVERRRSKGVDWALAEFRYTRREAMDDMGQPSTQALRWRTQRSSSSMRSMSFSANSVSFMILEAFQGVPSQLLADNPFLKLDNRGPFFVNGLPFGAIDTIKAAYRATVQIKDPPRDGFNLTLKINLSKLPANQDQRQSFFVKIASLKEVVLGAPLRVILKHLASRTVSPDINPLVALVHRPRELFFLIPKGCLE